MMLWNEIKKAMAAYPNQKVCEGNTEMTYRELTMFAEMYAEKLAGEKCCAILCGSEMAAAMALLSCFAAGVTAVPLSARYGEKHCNKILETVGPTAVITDLDGQLQIMDLKDATYIEPEEPPALIMCTSGTTGTPKGAMLSEHNLRTNVRDICAYLDVDKTDTILIARPLYHSAVLTGEFLMALFKGLKICFYSHAFNPKELLALIDERNISVMGGTPTLWEMMARFKRKRSVDLRTIFISGECMSAERGRKIRQAFPTAKIHHVYGLTEAAPRVSHLPPELFDEWPECVGVALDSVTLKIIKKDGSIAQTGEDGMLWVLGENVMLGYYNAPEQTAKVLKDGWLCTGDIATMDPNGLLRIKGRGDDLIIRAGMNIYPQEIERALMRDWRIRDVLVYKIETPNMGEQIAMTISGAFENIDEVRHLCAEVLPHFQIPNRIELVDELPKSGSGKMVRR